jgi:hypothetical protein
MRQGGPHDASLTPSRAIMALIFKDERRTPLCYSSLHRFAQSPTTTRPKHSVYRQTAEERLTSRWGIRELAMTVFESVARALLQPACRLAEPPGLSH